MRNLLVVLTLASLLGCAPHKVHVAPAPTADDFESLKARWVHEPNITRFAGYGPDEFCVISLISDATAVRYMVLVRVSSLRMTHVTTQRSPDDTETETLEVTLREGDTPEDLYANFSHSVFKQGILKLQFSGTTVLPRLDWE